MRLAQTTPVPHSSGHQDQSNNSSLLLKERQEHGERSFLRCRHIVKPKGKGGTLRKILWKTNAYSKHKVTLEQFEVYSNWLLKVTRATRKFKPSPNPD